MSRSSSLRLGVLLSHPIQYFAPLFRRLAATEGVDLTVLYCTDAGATLAMDPDFGHAIQWDVPLLEGYHYRVMPNVGRGDGFWRYLNPDVVREMQRGRYDALVVHGYNRATFCLAFAAGRRYGTPILMRGDSNLLNEPVGARGWIKHRLLTALYRGLDGALHIGSCNRDYYRYRGLSDAQLSFAPYSVDNQFFADAAERLRPRRGELRATLGVEDARPLILSCGKLVVKKQPLLLLEAYEEVRRRYPCALVYAGDGPLRAMVEQRVRERSIPDVRITGFLNQTQLPRVYAAADLFVLPSYMEKWGLVLNEAMNFGLPIIASDRVGAAYDLVRDGENGRMVPHHDKQALADALGILVADPEARAVQGERSRERIQEWGLEQCTSGFVRGCSQIPHGGELGVGGSPAAL